MGALHEDQYAFLIISHSVLLRMINVSDRSCRENQNTHFMFSNFFFFFFNSRYEIIWENIVELDRLQMTVLLMHIACWLPKSTNTHSEYVILFFHCNNGCMNAPQCCVIHTLLVLLTIHAEGLPPVVCL
jgi:hypothetical protein